MFREAGGEEAGSAVEVYGDTARDAVDRVLDEPTRHLDIALEKVPQGEAIFPAGHEGLRLGVDTLYVEMLVLAENHEAISLADPGLQFLFGLGLPVLSAQPAVDGGSGDGTA